MNYREVISAVSNPNPQMPCTELYKKKLGSEVYRIDTPAPLVVRFAPGDESHFKFQAELMEAIAANDEITPRIHFWKMDEKTNPIRGIQVQSYLPGVQLGHYPDPDESKAIVKAVYKTHQRLCDVSDTFKSGTCVSVDEVLKSDLSKVNDCPIKVAAKKLINHKRYDELLTSGGQYLSHFDLWPKNLLIEKEKDSIIVRIIDFDTVFGPKLLQPAVLFTSCFLVSSLMYRSAYLSLSDFEKVIGYWPEPLNRQDLLLMMQLFPIVLGLRIEHAFRRFPEYTKERYQSNTRLIMWCLENIWKWL